jgi:hypothetical protein
LNRYGSLDTKIADLQAQIDKARSTPSSKPQTKPQLPAGDAKP